MHCIGIVIHWLQYLNRNQTIGGDLFHFAYVILLFGSSCLKLHKKLLLSKCDFSVPNTAFMLTNLCVI